MKSTSRNGLIALNTVLVAVLGVISIVPVSDAQVPTQGQYHRCIWQFEWSELWCCLYCGHATQRW